MGSVYCQVCGGQLDAIPDLPTGERAPCPRCGSSRRSFDEECRVGTGLNAGASAFQTRDQEAVGYSESERQGRACAASLDKNGNLSYSLTGSSPQGEEDTLRVCQILVSRLNQAGGNWGQPSLVCDGPVDCEAGDLQFTGRKLHAQVVRANVDPDL